MLLWINSIIFNKFFRFGLAALLLIFITACSLSLEGIAEIDDEDRLIQIARENQEWEISLAALKKGAHSHFSGFKKACLLEQKE
ncbi:MAG: hypothetical protein HUK40_13450 [Desulfobacter sp.]|nr:hypothetical protein [Desulfobacter sp.]WDP87824.1 MAG: hypothetical protein HUN05_24015 [Desulfobacter sp.]